MVSGLGVCYAGNTWSYSLSNSMNCLMSKMYLADRSMMIDIRGISVKKTTAVLKSLWNDESGQGATEYILLLVVVVGLALMFKDKIRAIVDEKMGELNTEIGGFKPQ